MKGSPRTRSVLHGSMKTILACSAGATALLGLATPALAQTPPAASDSLGLEDIVVTAQRRGQNLQDVPVAVTAFKGESLLERGIARAMDLQQVDSSLNITMQSGVIIPFLRGVGNPGASTAGNEASAPIYIDDVYYSRLAPAYLELANIERVEVLKGPQGTLFGRNATGGLIQIFTRDPGQKPVVDATVGYGNYQTYSGKLYLSTPLSDDVAIDLSAVGSDQKDGWGRNFTLNKDIYRNKFYNIRSKLVAQLTDTTKVRLSAFYAYQNTDVGTATTLYRGTRGLPPTYTTQFIPPPGFFDSVSDFPSLFRNRSYGGSLKIDQELGFADFVSISSYRRGKELYKSEGDHTHLDFLNYTLQVRDREITQELQLKSGSGSKINWILGAFYINSKQGFSPTSIGGGALTGGPGNPSGILTQNLYGLQTINSYAGFGQATFPVADEKTNITLGLRYTKDYVKGFGRTTLTAANGTEFPIAPDYRQKVNFNKLTYKAVVDHKFTPDIMSYVSFSRGYKSGTFNTLPLDSPPTRPETVDAYEIGVKASLFDRRVRSNIAIFQNDVRNPQVQLIKNVAGIASVQFANAEKARTKGVEFDTTAILADGLTLNLAGQYLYARFIDFKNAPFSTPLTTAPFGLSPAFPGDASGNRMPQTPKYKINLGLTYETQTDIGGFTVSGNMAYRSNFKWDPDNVATEPALTLFNASIIFKPAFNENLSFRVWGANLTDEHYFSNQLTINSSVGYTGSVAPPRTYGVEVRYAF